MTVVTKAQTKLLRHASNTHLGDHPIRLYLHAHVCDAQLVWECGHQLAQHHVARHGELCSPISIIVIRKIPGHSVGTANKEVGFKAPSALSMLAMPAASNHVAKVPHWLVSQCVHAIASLETSENTQ